MLCKGLVLVEKTGKRRENEGGREIPLGDSNLVERGYIYIVISELISGDKSGLGAYPHSGPQQHNLQLDSRQNQAVWRVSGVKGGTFALKITNIMAYHLGQVISILLLLGIF